MRKLNFLMAMTMFIAIGLVSSCKKDTPAITPTATTPTTTNKAPSVPTGANPADGATNVSMATTLSWAASTDPENDPVTYDVYFGTLSTPPLVKSGATTTSYSPGTLAANTKYYWKIVAKDNQSNSTPGAVWSFTTGSNSSGGNGLGPIVFNPGSTYGTMTDSRDNKTYKTIVIGTQTWMAQNLNYTPTSGSSWCYNDSSQYCDVYGRFYDWTTAMNGAASSSATPSGVKGICPTGWHLPSDAEWTVLSTYLGGDDVAGGKLKETGTTHWYSPNNTSADNSSGFSGLPAGNRYVDGSFYLRGNNVNFWSSTEYDASGAYDRSLYYDSAYLFRDYGSKTDAFSVRCVKD
jgi:uncharacterized protein (TIGR02145 family)